MPFLIAIALLIRIFQIKLIGDKEKESSPFFISDAEGRTKDDDLLNYSDQAIRFSERVFNGGSADSLVFGIDAPWGIGKSTFVNFCIESWEDEKYDHKVVIYKFNPLRYEDRTNLLEKFIDGLVVTLQKDSFTPEIRPLVSKYSRLIKSKGTFSIFGMEFELFPGNYTVDDAFDDLEGALGDFDKKVIVIIDDLDRLSFSAIKDVLFAIKKSFTLPNISYVLCYDTENLVALEKDSSDADKIREFLEKFINVKISLFLDAEILSRYVSDNFHKALQENLQLGVHTRDKLMDAINVLIDIYKSPEFSEYQPFLGNIRKLKRLINTMMLFEIESVDFENTDFNKQDLVNLILLYINYPHIFRDIYNAETGGKRGVFSVVIPYDDGYPRASHTEPFRDGLYENSLKYKTYIDGLKKSPNAKFLLNQIFDVSIRLPSDRKIDSVSEEIKKTYACFNGDGVWSGGRNLEDYLNLIVKLSKPQIRSQYKFYLNCKESVKRGTPIEDVLQGENFDFSAGEASQDQLWRIIVNSVSEFDHPTASALISYLLDHITDYSLVSSEKIGLGFRDTVEYLLVKLLDTAGWVDPNGQHFENTEDNLSEISEWIFGENQHQGKGVLETLGKEDRGVVGLYDLVSFRLSCNSSRGSHLFNLQRSLIRHNDPGIATSGGVRDIAMEMREISQRTFSIFKEQYILKQQDLFELIDNLSVADVSGKYFEYIQAQIDNQTISSDDLDIMMSLLRYRMKVFIVYQLGNSFANNSGIGCGYYDENGSADQGGISKAFNQYLFTVCFTPDEKGYRHLLDYLLMSFASVLSHRNNNHKADIKEFTKVIDRKLLVEYWKTYGDVIKSLHLENEEKTINAGNYSISYAAGLSDVYTVLDKALNDDQISS